MNNNEKVFLCVLAGATVVGIGVLAYSKRNKVRSVGADTSVAPVVINKGNVSASVADDKRSLLFVGDSLTSGYGLGDKSFVDKIKNDHPEVDVRKVAVMGKQTGWMLSKLKDELSSGGKYDTVIIWGGINDIYATNSISEAKNNLQRMFELCRKYGAKVVCLNVIPTGGYKPSTKEKKRLTEELNSWIKANRLVDIVYDVNSVVGDGGGFVKSGYLQKDSLHLTDLAQSKVSQDIFRLLK